MLTSKHFIESSVHAMIEVSRHHEMENAYIHSLSYSFLPPRFYHNPLYQTNERALVFVLSSLFYEDLFQPNRFF